MVMIPRKLSAGAELRQKDAALTQKTFLFQKVGHLNFPSGICAFSYDHQERRACWQEEIFSKSRLNDRAEITVEDLCRSDQRALVSRLTSMRKLREVVYLDCLANGVPLAVGNER